MSKLLDCPYCNAKGVPVRNDAEVCSSKCRKRKQRIKEKELANEQDNKRN